MSDGDLVPLAGGIWTVSGTAKLAPGLYFPVRATIVRLASSGILIHNPVAFSDETVRAIRKLGDVVAILSPNLFHNLFVASAAKHFPDAALLGPEGISKKLPGLQLAEFNGSELCAPLAADFDQVLIGGAPRMNELVLCHRETKSLLVADYFFNIHKTRGWMTPLVLKYVSGAYKRPAQSKLWRKFTEDQAAAKQSAKDVLALDFKRIVMCHGEDVVDGRSMAERELAWLTES